MKILITGICGFVGSQLARSLKARLDPLQLFGIDNLLRPGSEMNRTALRDLGVAFTHADIRVRSDVEALPACDWVIDGAANPSVLAGIDGRSSPRQLCEHNLGGTLNILEYCRLHRAGLILLSTNRVYSVRDLAALPMKTDGRAFRLDAAAVAAVGPAGAPAVVAAGTTAGVSEAGIAESFPTTAPISMYGATKLASEVMANEYRLTFDFPLWINRCGVLAGAGQFGTAEQGIFSYWLHAHAARRPLRYIGFGGHGFQVRDVFHPDDLAALIAIQLRSTPPSDPVFHAGGGTPNSMSLAQLTDWCDLRFGKHQPVPDDRPRPFDAPWLVMDSRRSREQLGWQPQRSLPSILEEIEAHVHANPGWLARTGSQ